MASKWVCDPRVPVPPLSLWVHLIRKCRTVPGGIEQERRTNERREKENPKKERGTQQWEQFREQHYAIRIGRGVCKKTYNNKKARPSTLATIPWISSKSRLCSGVSGVTNVSPVSTSVAKTQEKGDPRSVRQPNSTTETLIPPLAAARFLFLSVFPGVFASAYTDSYRGRRDLKNAL